jgi:antitoxin (DNA-binding transcriptional repressor) of toxin-antitoxin stability system
MTIGNDYGERMNQEHVTKSQFKAKALEYFRKVETSGESVVITDRGEPTVEVRRYRSDKRSPLERLRGSVIEFREPTGPVGEEDWEALG